MDMRIVIIHAFFGTVKPCCKNATFRVKNVIFDFDSDKREIEGLLHVAVLKTAVFRGVLSTTFAM